MTDAPEPPLFATTRWSVIARAKGEPGDEAHDALTTLCESYWYPIYAFLRRRAGDAERARDLTQGFFTHLLDKGDLRRADPERGRFRSFLLTAARNYAANVHAAEGALKRGGGEECLSLDFATAEGRFRLEAVEHETPEHLFEVAWARALLGRAMDRLRGHYEDSGRAALFEALQGSLAGLADGTSLAALAAGLGMTEGAVKTALSRLRRRYREHLRAEIAETVADPAEIEDEIRALFAALG